MDSTKLVNAILFECPTEIRIGFVEYISDFVRNVLDPNQDSFVLFEL